MVARLIGFGITFCIPLVLARRLELEAYGTYKQLFLVAQVLYAVLPLGVAQSLYYFLPRVERPRAILAQTQALLLVTGALGGVTVALGLETLGGWVDNPSLGAFALPLGLYAFGLVAAYPLEVSLTSSGRVKTCAAVALTSDALRASALLTPILLGVGLEGALWCIAGWSLLRLVAALGFGVLSAQGDWTDRAALSTQLRYALPFGIAMVLGLPSYFAHEWIVSAQLGPALYAIYAVGCFQVPIVDILYSPTCEVLMVRLRELEHEGLAEKSVALFSETVGRLAYLFVPLVAFLVAAAPEFITTLFGAKFAASVPIFRVSVIGILFACLPLDAVLRARGETRFLMVVYAVRAIVAVPFVLTGVQFLGLTGAILGFVATEAVGNLVLASRVPAVLGVKRFSDLLPHRALSKAFGAAALAASLVFVLRMLTDGSWPEETFRLLPLASAGVLFSLAYLLALRVSGERPSDVLLSVLRRQGV